MSFLNFAGNQGVTFKNHGTGGGTTFTLDAPASTNSVLLQIGGIIQANAVDFNVTAPTTITTTSSVTAGIPVYSWIIHKPGTAPVIQDNSITNAKMVDDAIGIAELSATGTPSATTFLAGNNSWAEAGGGLKFIGTSAASGSGESSLTVTGIDSTYDTYLISVANLVGDGGSTDVRFRIGDSSGVKSDSKYSYHASGGRSGASTARTAYGQNQAQIAFALTGDNIGGSSNDGFGMVAYLTAPSDSAAYATISGTFSYLCTGAEGMADGGSFSASYETVISHDRVNISFSSGSITAGRITVHGLSNS